jgi:hypothetical protein
MYLDYVCLGTYLIVWLCLMYLQINNRTLHGGIKDLSIYKLGDYSKANV